MGLATAAAGSALAGGTQSLFNGIMGGISADKEYSYARRLQKHDQAFQKEMRETAYQTMVGDMEKAGINPAVALSGGAGQAMGGSSSQSAPNVNMGHMDIASIMQAMGTTALTQAQKENIEADTELKTKQTGKTETESKAIKQQIDIDKNLADAEMKLKEAQTSKEKETANQIMQAALQQKIQNIYEATRGRKMPDSWLDNITSRIYSSVMKLGGSTTGLEPLIEAEIKKYERR